MDATANVQAGRSAKNAGLFHSLNVPHDVVGSVVPEVSPRQLWLHRLGCFHPVRHRWRSRANLHPRLFAARSRVAGAALKHWGDRFDLIVQLHTLMGPGLPLVDRPYVLHTDNTLRLSERGWPQWAPWKGRRRDEWVAMEGAVYRQAAFVFPRSEWLRRSLIDDYHCDPKRVIRVGGGANFRRSTLDGKRWDTQKALFVGRDFARKGGPELLAAWREVRRALPRAVLQIVGIHTPPCQLPEGVEWLGVIDQPSRLQHLFEEASLFVMPSRFEPWGHVFYEAMGSGLPCIAADTCAMPEIVTPEVGGVVPPRDARALAHMLIGLLGSPDHAEALGRAGWAAVESGHSWKDVVDRMAPYLERAVG